MAPDPGKVADLTNSVSAAARRRMLTIVAYDDFLAGLQHVGQAELHACMPCPRDEQRVLALSLEGVLQASLDLIHDGQEPA